MANENPYLDLMEGMGEGDDARFRASTSLAIDLNADQAAAAKRVAGFLGVPPAVVEAAPDEAQRRARVQKLSQDTADAPTLRRMYGDPEWAKLAHDDSGPLSAVEKAIRSFMSPRAAPKPLSAAAAVITGSEYSERVRELMRQNPLLDADTARALAGQGVRVDNQAAPAPSAGTRSYLGASALAGVQDLLGVGAKLLDRLNPFTTSPEEAAVLFRNDPAGLARFNASPANLLGRITDAMSQASDQTMRELSPAAQRDYTGLEYATTDPSNAAYLSPVRVIGDAMRSLPTSAAMALSIVLTRGAAAKAEADALAAGATPIVARQAGVTAAGAAMARYSGASEGVVGYAQQANQTVADLQKLSDEKMQAAPEYQALLAQGYAPEAARQLVTQQTGEQAGLLAGIVDAAVNFIGGRFLGHVIGEGGKLLPRVGKGVATEGITEFVQSGGEQVGQNMAMQRNVDPQQSLWEGVLESMVQGLVVGGVTGGAFAGFGGAGHANVQAQRAEETATKIEQLAKAMEASKLRGRDATEFSQFVAQIAQERGEAPSELYVGAEHLANVLNQSAMTLPELRAIAPAMADQLEATHNVPGADVRVPVAELAAAGSEVTTALLDHLREAPDAMSRAEAREFMAREGDHIQQEVQHALGQLQEDQRLRESRAAVQADVLQQLKATGRFSETANAAYAALWANFFATQAARTGVAPHELYQRFGPKIVAQARAGAVLDQSAPGAPLAQSGGNDSTTPPAPAGLTATGSYSDGGKWKRTYRTVQRTDGTFALERTISDDDGERTEHMAQDGSWMKGEAPRTAAMGAHAEEHGPESYPTAEHALAAARDDSADGTVTPPAAAAVGQTPGVTRGSFDPTSNTVALLAAADLSTFLHESGHFFLEVQGDLAARIDAAIRAGESVSEAERAIVNDMGRILKWFGVKGSPERTPLQQWLEMSLHEKRQFHERWARGFERYVMEGQAPSLELQQLFARFRAWLVQVYRTLTALNVDLSPDVREVMGRMLASDAAIGEAHDARALGPLFRTPETAAGMTPEEYAEYQATAEHATAAASAQLDTRLMKDMRWLSRARDKALKAAQATAAAARAEVEREVRTEVMAASIYRAWTFLTAKPVLAQDQSAREASVREVRDWERKREEAEQAALRAEREKLYAANPDVKGIAKGQLAAKNKRQMHINVQQQMLEWDRANPKPALAPRAMDDLGPEFATGKLNADAVKQTAPGAHDTLKSRKMLGATGLAPDVVAELFGFNSGEQLVKALALAPSPTEAIQELTDQRMLERHGDITSPQALQRAADEAVHNELRARVIAQELKALAKANTVRATGDSLYRRETVDVMAKAAREFAEKVVARQKIKDLRPAQYAAAEARSGKLAEQSLGKGTSEAAMHKRNQLVNNFAAKAAYDAQREVQEGRDFFRTVLTGAQDKVSKARDFDVVQAARAILADYGMGTRGEAAQRYLEAVQRNDPAMYQVLRDKVDNLTLNARPMNELTVEELRGLVEEIHSMWQLAKRSRQIEVDGQLIDIEAAKLPLVERMEAIGIPDRVPGEGRAVTDAERRVSRLRSLGAALRRVESWVEAKDGQAMGPFRQFVWQPVKEAADRYRADKAKHLKAYRDLLAQVEFPEARVDAPELGYTFGFSRGGSGKAEILHALLHTGNESNMRKLLLGRGWGQVLETGELDTRRWDAFVNRMVREGVLTRADFDFAQGVWDLLEGMKPIAQKAHRDVFGRYFDEITARGFTIQLPDGAAAFRGGYVPAVMDPEVVKDAATRALQEDENATLAYAFPSTPKGFTKSRVEVNRPLLLDLRYLAQHIDKVLLFSHLEQPIRDVRKVLTSKEVSTPLHRIDPAAFDGILTPWMNRAARQTVETKVPGDNNLMRFFAKARSRAGMAAMLANVSNAAQQITGLSIAAVKVRPGLLADATVQWVKAPRQVSRAVAEASPYMASRMDNEVATMNDAIEQILLNPSVYAKAQAWTSKHAYFLQSAIDNVVGPIVWTGAYNQALEQGHSDADALRLADAAVRLTQGSTLPEDVARIETGNAFVRMFTQFAGYFNMQANLLGTEFANLMQEQGLRRGMGRGLYVFTLGFMVPAMVSEVIVQAMRGGPDDEDKDGSTVDDWLMAVLLMANIRAGLAMVPGVGQAANAAINTLNKKPYDDRISTSPAISMIESAVKAPVEVYKAVKDDGNRRAAVRDLATLISMTTGLPAAAAARPLGYMAGVSQERIAPTGPVDTARGLVTGTPSPDSKR